MDPVPGRVENNKIRLVREIADHFEHVPGDKLTVGKPVERRVLPRGLHGLLHDLHAHDLGGHRRPDLGDGSGAAVEIEHHLVLRLPHIAAGRLIEHLRPQRVGLEK